MHKMERKTPALCLEVSWALEQTGSLVGVSYTRLLVGPRVQVGADAREVVLPLLWAVHGRRAPQSQPAFLTQSPSQLVSAAKPLELPSHIVEQ